MDFKCYASVYFQKDFTPEKKSGGRGAKKAGGRGKKKVTHQLLLHIRYNLQYLLWQVVISSAFMHDVTEGLIWLRLRLWVGLWEESGRQRIRGREASAGSIWLRVPVRIQVRIRLGSTSAEGTTGTQERFEFSLVKEWTHLDFHFMQWCILKNA